MKILALVASRRKNGNTALLARTVMEAARTANPELETELLFLGDYTIDACTGCEGCRNSWNCIIKDDFGGIIQKIDAADGIILASPTYWYSVTSDMKRFIDRCYSLIQYPVNRHQWTGKYDNTGKKCVTIAVCEQTEVSMMGNTLTLLEDFSRDIGLDWLESVKALGFFKAGTVAQAQNLLDQARKAGRNMAEASSLRRNP